MTPQIESDFVALPAADPPLPTKLLQPKLSCQGATNKLADPKTVVLDNSRASANFWKKSVGTGWLACATEPCSTAVGPGATSTLGDPKTVVLDDSRASASFWKKSAGTGFLACVTEPCSTAVAPGTTKPGKAGSRPRKDLKSAFRSYRGPLTTLMIRNIPCRVAQAKLAEAVESVGFAGKYDYLFVPTGGRPSKAGVSNLGYAFINLPDPRDAVAFTSAFAGYKFAGAPSQKKIVVGFAHVQGSGGAEALSSDGAPKEAGLDVQWNTGPPQEGEFVQCASRRGPSAIGLHKLQESSQSPIMGYCF